jgi:Ca-activated chloride channel family protein
MSFQAPLFLLALLALPVAGIAYQRSERRRRSQSVAFSAVPTLPSVLAERPGWRRHAPVLGYAAAALLLALALARPQLAIGTDEQRTQLVLSIDRSGSMGRDDIQPSRIEASRAAASEFVTDAPDRVRVGLVTFNDKVRTVEPPSQDRESVLRALERMRPGGGTDLAGALSASLSQIGPGARGESAAPAAAVVLLSDGVSRANPLPAAREAARANVPVHTVVFGEEVGGGGMAAMGRIAQITGGRTYSAEDRTELSGIYAELGARTVATDEPLEITGFVAGAAALFACAGGLMSLRWFGRLP